MHPNPIFRSDDQSRDLAFAADRGFGVLTINGAGGPLMSHIPFILSQDGRFVDFHLVRSNPIARKGGGAKALLAVSGPDGYVSPDWYGVEQQVPTWNYVAVHLRGVVEVLPADALEPHLRALSSEFERRLAPKPVWMLDKVTSENRTKMMRMIAPVRMEITSVDATWKLGQNKPDAAREAVATAMKDSAVGYETAALAAIMKKNSGE